MAAPDKIDGIPVDALVVNARGLALAAFADPATIARLLGGDTTAAAELQETASHQFAGLRVRVEQARKGRAA